MLYTIQEHYLFLEEELRAQTDLFNQKLNTSASYLLFEREEIFVAKFIKQSLIPWIYKPNLAEPS